MTFKYRLFFVVSFFCLFLSPLVQAQTCAIVPEVTASAGGTVAAATSLTVYNSTEAGPDGAAARTAVDAQDDTWRSGVLAVNPLATFNTWSDTTTAQGNSALPVVNAFQISGINVTYDYRDFPTNFRTVAAPCIGTTIAAAGERVAFLAKTASMQGSENAPRPASLYNTANQPIIYDEIQAGAQPGRAGTINAVSFAFSETVRAFGVWFGDSETRTDGVGNAMIVRLLDAGGNRIGSDVVIQPRAGSQTGCGNTNVGCGNQTTRWIGFHDTAALARVTQMIVITGWQGGSSTVGSQRLSFIGPTIPSAPTAASANLSGRVTTPNGRGIRNVRVSLQNSQGIDFRSAITGSFGYYQFMDIPVGSTYLVSVTAKRFVFDPNIRVITFLDELADVDFIADR